MEEKNEKPEIFSKKVKAGKRTYFFDIKPTKSGDYYLTITESKKRLVEDSFVYEKHKIFLYKEDVKKFSEALEGTIDYLKENLMPHYNFDKEPEMDSEFETEEKRSYKF